MLSLLAVPALPLVAHEGAVFHHPFTTSHYFETLPQRTPQESYRDPQAATKCTYEHLTLTG
jgi:hypothetical protein